MEVDLIRVLVGPDYREFVVHRALLCAASTFFRDSVDAVPAGLTSSPTASPTASPASLSSSSASAPSSPSSTPIIWLAGESADVFELFVLWLYRRNAFRAVVDDAVTILAAEAAPSETIILGSADNDEKDKDENTSASANITNLHWHLVNLHLFAAVIDIPALQDNVMDALQDLYLRFDWAATPALLHLLYVDADPVAAMRLRKWAVALLVWTFAVRRGGDHQDKADAAAADSDVTDAEDRALLALLSLPALRADFDAHCAKMDSSRADARIKNPQLRIPSNHLRREDRHFGFRQCSFHSHRRTVGQGRCPHSPRRQPRSSADSNLSGLAGLGSLLSPTSTASSSLGSPGSLLSPDSLGLLSPDGLGSPSSFASVGSFASLGSIVSPVVAGPKSPSRRASLSTLEGGPVGPIAAVTVERLPATSSFELPKTAVAAAAAAHSRRSVRSAPRAATTTTTTATTGATITSSTTSSTTSTSPTHSPCRVGERPTPRRPDPPAWSPLSAAMPTYVPLGMESTV